MPARASFSLATSLAKRVKASRQRYRKRLERCQRKFSETAVHDLRIETRRMLAMLDLLRALRVPGPIRKIRKLFKKRLDAFDELRDTHVQLALLQPLWRQFPEARGLDVLLSRRERRLVNELRKGLHATKHTRLERRLKNLEKELRGLVGEMAPGLARPAILAALRETFDRVVALRQRIRPSRTATIHRTRVAFKRFRYLCESLHPYLTEMRKEDLNRMRQYQAMMGNIQDIEVLLAGVRRAVEDREMASRGVSPLRQALLRRRRDLIANYLAAADTLFDFAPEPLARPPGRQATIEP